MSYGKIVKKIRASQPTNNNKIMSYAKFSKITGISATQLERLEKEQSNPPVMKLKPTIDSLKQICDRTGYSFRQFLEEAGYIEASTLASSLNAAQLACEGLNDIEQEYVIRYINETFFSAKPKNFEN